MKFCPKCGTSVANDVIMCPHCGTFVPGKSESESSSSSSYYNPAMYQNSFSNQEITHKGMKLAIKIFLILAIVSVVISFVVMMNYSDILKFMLESNGQTITSEELQLIERLGSFLAFFCLVPLAWLLPMTISAWKKMNTNRPLGTAFKVCTLLFINIIPGILMLCNEEI